MNWSSINEALADLVNVATRAKLPFIAQQLHAVPRVVDDDSFMVLCQRIDTIRTLLVLNPPKQAPAARTFLTRFSNLVTLASVIENDIRS